MREQIECLKRLDQETFDAEAKKPIGGCRAAENSGTDFCSERLPTTSAGMEIDAIGVQLAPLTARESAHAGCVRIFPWGDFHASR
ncbi:MAG: hypothetical protein N2444_08375, partial [Methylocystis sp.]|nr:hypothetical protein [Methylocystis sp.]